MKAFAYAAPRTEAEVLDVLSAGQGSTQLLAGGTDLVGLMKEMIVQPDLVVNLMEVDSMRGIQTDSLGVSIGAATTLDEVLEDRHLQQFPALLQAIKEISSIQLQSQGTLCGELLHRPRCWYFRNGHGLLADNGKAVQQGDSRFHAIFGNGGPAKFVSSSRLAPALIALNARLRVIGPAEADQAWLPLKDLYRTPRDEHQAEHVLQPGQVVTQIHVPHAAGWESATYEVKHGAGPDPALASASVALRIESDIVRDARIVLGQVAPTPWISKEARAAIVGVPVAEQTAVTAGEEAVRKATPLKDNHYKVQLARVAVKRAILRAAGLETGGL